MPERKTLPFFVDPKSFDAKNVHVIGGDVRVDSLVCRVVAFGQGGGFHGWTFGRAHHFVRNSAECETVTRFVDFGHTVRTCICVLFIWYVLDGVCLRFGVFGSFEGS